METVVAPPLDSVPAGRWAIGVSGGADSVALLMLIADWPDISLHVVHLDHQLRGAESTGDARFVAELAARLGLQCTIAQRGQLERDVPKLPANPSVLSPAPIRAVPASYRATWPGGCDPGPSCR